MAQRGTCSGYQSREVHAEIGQAEYVTDLASFTPLCPGSKRFRIKRRLYPWLGFNGNDCDRLFLVIAHDPTLHVVIACIVIPPKKLT